MQNLFFHYDHNIYELEAAGKLQEAGSRTAGSRREKKAPTPKDKQQKAWRRLPGAARRQSRS
ncbi:MAG: hypothetical protein WBM10_00515 [Limnochordia bacterium]